MDTENDSIRITGRDDDSATEKILFSGVIQAIQLSRYTAVNLPAMEKGNLLPFIPLQTPVSL